jgi:MscS family membrane protein
MNNFNWNRLVLDNLLSQYLIVIGIIICTFFLKRLVGKLVAILFDKFVQRFGRKVDHKAFSPLVLQRVETFLFLLIAFSTLDSLTFPRIFNIAVFKTNTKAIAWGIETAIMIAVFFSLMLRLIDYMAAVLETRAASALAEDNQLIVFFKDFLKVIVVIIGLLMILQFVFQQNISQILAGLSIAGAAIALAARESLENLIASFIIFFDKPFATGDLLKVNNIVGVVEKIGLRSTRIRTIEKTSVSVPNKQMVDSVVDNLSLRTHRRAELKLELEVETGSEQIEAFLQQAKLVLQENKLTDYSVFLNDISATSIVIQIEYFTETISIKDFFLVKQTVTLQMIQLIEKLKIKIGSGEKNIKVFANPT